MTDDPFPFVLYLIVVDRLDAGLMPVFYVGITQDYVKRIEQHYHRAFGNANRRRAWLHHTMAKYGRDAVFHREVGRRATREEINDFERETIATLREEHGEDNVMNILDGGDGVTPETARKFWEAKTPEERKASHQKRVNAMTPEQRSAAVKKQHANMTPEARAERSRKIRENTSAETLAIRAEKISKSLTSEERSEIQRNVWAKKSSEVRSEILRKTNAAMTSEARARRAKAAAERSRRAVVDDLGNRFLSVTDAANAVGVNVNSITQAIKRAGKSAGRRWSYVTSQKESA